MGNVPRRKLQAGSTTVSVEKSKGREVHYLTQYGEDPLDPFYILPFLRRVVGPEFGRRIGGDYGSSRYRGAGGAGEG